MSQISPNSDFPWVTQKESPTISTTSNITVPVDDQWGADTVTIWFRVNPDGTDAQNEFWKKSSTESYSDTGNTNLRHVGWLDIGSYKVRVTLRIREATCSLSFNAARVLTNKSAYLLPPLALSAVVEKLLDKVSEFITPAFDKFDPHSGELTRDTNWESQVNISRLDIARNLKIPFQKAWLKQAIELQVPSYGRHTIIHHKPQGGWTVQNVTKSDGQDRIYDKYEELKNHEVEDAINMETGLFRFESQLMGERLKRHKLTTLADVNDETVWNALQTRWDMCKWGVALGGVDPVTTAIGQLEISQQEGLLGFLHLSSLDAYADKSTSHYKRMVRLASRHGFNPGMPISSMSNPEYRLELFAGSLVPFAQEGEK